MVGDTVMFQVVILGLVCYGLTIVVQCVMWMNRRRDTTSSPMECPACGDIELRKTGEFRYHNAIHGIGDWHHEMECESCGHYEVM